MGSLMRTFGSLLAASLLVLFSTGQVAAQAKASKTITDELDGLINQRFPETKCPGLSIAVSRDKQIIFSKAVGLADVEQNVVMKPDSVQRLASLSKPISATIVMSLVEQGKLALDASIRSYLPELPASYQSVTLRLLLDHQSGVRGFTDAADVAFNTSHFATSREVLKTFMAHPLVFEPGAKVEYSSLSFTIIGAAAEAVTGLSFQQLATRFFSEHEITGLFLDDPLAMVPRRVRGYLVDPSSSITFNTGQVLARDYLAGTTGAITNARFYDISNRYPAGGFDASPEDLMKFALAVATARLLRSETVRTMWTAQQTQDGAKTVFGLGWGVSQFRGHLMVGMNGAEPGSTAFLRYLPDSGTGVVIVCNAEGALGLDSLLNDVLERTTAASKE
jgi:CubicO group peptidase (beta-lactamase class C family)